METSTSSIISALGAGSGVDMAALASNLAEVQYARRLDVLRAKSETLDAKISAASQLKNQVTQLASALGERVRTGDLAPTPSISNGAVAHVTRSTASRPAGSYSLEVFSLASAQTLSSPAYGAATDLAGEGTLTLRFGTVSGASFTADGSRAAVDLTISATDTLSDVANAINAANTGVTAYIANAADGARLVLKGDEGAANGFVLEATEGGTSGLSNLAWEPTSGDPARLVSASTDAQFAIDGIALTSASNAVGVVVPGVSLTLTGTNAGNPATISFGDPTSAIQSMMEDLTSALNEIISSVIAAMDPQSGDLARDDGAKALRRELSQLGSTVIMPNAAAGEPATLAELGLAIGRDGSFSFNAATLEKVVAENPEAVAAMFTNGLYGVYATVDKIARNVATSTSPGSLAGSVKSYNSQLTGIDEQNAKVAEQQENLRARLTKQFTAAETHISASKSTLSFLEAQIALWTKSEN